MSDLKVAKSKLGIKNILKVIDMKSIERVQVLIRSLALGNCALKYWLNLSHICSSI